MTSKKVTLVLLLLCVAGILFLDHLTIQHQRERITALLKQNFDLQAKLEIVHLQEQLNQTARKPGTPAPSAAVPKQVLK